ncbi:MAG: hypothetical protein A2664_00275 [Candidatus Taylorbacteria bacterium RIFCSPHIGHO2_01_FULL_46_22b]|uniref:AraC-type arabinose-binding/dimerisation domain-containing protein n=1 Tax=Candidatus Taylorbacteria bacterium RIFCSPHIGHO2_01_FULL_46_22b TaxID=1802301 RepID=A0A1G2M423_9BACT|nr:MAG: hypothetical protein A2664_00275 [Candidatus Taylorbacteria bacterium RIFCSPHIGHO2_01_FULL_46_22b]
MLVRLQKAVVGGHEDHRRVITDIVVEDIPFPVVQTKVIRFKPESVGKFAVGNHYHIVECNRWEFFVAVGPPALPLFTFRWCEAGQTANHSQYIMHNGDACLIPPGNSHAFMPDEGGASLWGFSNLQYDSAHDVPEKLF